MNRARAAFAAAAVAGLTFAGATAVQAAPSPNNHLLKIIKVTTDSVTVQTSCPADPPDHVIVSFPERGVFGGIVPIDCDGSKQKVTVPLISTLTAGDSIFVYATVSGDSGEINDWGTFRVHR